MVNLNINEAKNVYQMKKRLWSIWQCGRNDGGRTSKIWPKRLTSEVEEIKTEFGDSIIHIITILLSCRIVTYFKFVWFLTIWLCCFRFSYAFGLDKSVRGFPKECLLYGRQDPTNHIFKKIRQKCIFSGKNMNLSYFVEK